MYTTYLTHIENAVAARDDLARELKDWPAVFKAIDNHRPTAPQLSGTTPMLMTINEYVGLYIAFIRTLSVTDARKILVNRMRSDLANLLNQQLECTPELTYATVDRKLDELIWTPTTTVTDEGHSTVHSSYIPGVGTVVLMKAKESDDDDDDKGGDDKGGDDKGNGGGAL